MTNTDAASAIATVYKGLKNFITSPIGTRTVVEDRTFVSSFSENDASLTLWRLYAGQNGFCLGFDEDLLLSWFGANVDMGGNASRKRCRTSTETEIEEGMRANSTYSGLLQPVYYGLDRVRILADRVAESSNVEGDDFVRSTLRDLAFIKHQSFEDEREHRLVVHDNYCIPGAQVRVKADGQLVSFLKIKFPFEALRSVTIAPGADVDTTTYGLESLLSTGGRGAWGHVHMRVSPLPFRW